MTVQVEIAKRVDNDLVVAFQRLIPQLSKSNPAPTQEQLESIVASDSSYVLIAKVDGVIVGSLTLVIFHIPTGIRAWIEDVVVDADARGKFMIKPRQREPAEIANHEERMRIDRIRMKEIVLHPAHDPPERGDIATEYAIGVHTPHFVRDACWCT